MSSHFHTGISNCCSSPEGFWCSVFTCEQVKHLDTYSAISFFIPIHQKLFLKSWYILLFPGCMVYLDLWASSKILFLKFSLLRYPNSFLVESPNSIISLF
ncbi:hypothetical protein Hanom_Chr12g01108441 [Helianthus anomalus]